MLKIWNRLPPPTFDPIGSGTAHSLVYSGQIFSQLVRVDPSQARLDVLVGDLAENWDVSPDGKEYTFHLRQGVTWHDGKPFTADDVVFSLNYMTDPDKSAIAQTFVSYESSTAVDSHTVKVRLSQPQASFLQMLAQGFSVILPKHIVESGVDPKSEEFLVGTGPFKFKSWDGSTFTVVKNPDYFVPGLPHLDEVQISVIEDREPQQSAFLSRQVDMTQPWFGFDEAEAATELAELAPDATVEHRTVGRVVLFWGKHEPGKPWNDLRVRQAFSLILNRESLVIAGSGDAEWGEPGGYLVPGTVWARGEDELAASVRQGEPSEADIARARQLMADAGYGSGFKISVLHRDLAYQTRVVSAMGSALKKYLNVEVTSDVRDTASFLQMLRDGQFEYLLDGFSLSVSEPDQALTLFVKDSSQNIGGYANPDYDALVLSQSRTTDPAMRNELVRQAEDILLTDLPALSLYWSDYGAAWWPHVHGFVMQPSLYTNITLDQVWVD